MAHTKGPWRVRWSEPLNTTVIDAGGECLARHISNDNAHLMAAAPEMIRALRAVRKEIEALASDTDGWREWDATAVDQLLGSRLVRLDDLIAKAEGRE